MPSDISIRRWRFARTCPRRMLQLGNIALDNGDAAQARDIVQRYLAVNAPTAEVLWLGVRTERKLGDSVAAAVYARRVQAEFPDSEQAQMYALRHRAMTDPVATTGPRLKAERERRGLSSQKAADELHLDGWIIDALEAEDYLRIGPSVYAKGHLKRYAALLGLPAAEIMAGYESRAQAPKAPPSQPATVRLRTDAPAASKLPWPRISERGRARSAARSACSGGSRGINTGPDRRAARPSGRIRARQPPTMRLRLPGRRLLPPPSRPQPRPRPRPRPRRRPTRRPRPSP